MSSPRRAVVVDIVIATIAGSLALAVYVRSLAPGLLWGDSAEFQFAAWLGGFAHPTGYPLYLILGWLWSHTLPFGEPAYRMNLFSALWGGVAVALLCLLLMHLLRFVDARAQGGSARLVAFAAGLLFTFTPTFWSNAVIAEVYTLHAAFIAALLLALLVWAERVFRSNSANAWPQLYLVALLFGLSLTHHRSTILLFPAIVVFMAGVLHYEAVHLRPTLRQVLLVGVALLAPLILYLIIPLRAPHVPYYQIGLAPGQHQPLYESTVAGFLAHVSGSVFSTALTAPQARSLDMGGLVGRFADELSPNGLILGVLGIGWLLVRGASRRDRRVWLVLGLTGIFFLSQVAFNLFYAIGDIHVFYIPAYLVWLLWMAFGAWTLGLGVAFLIGRLGNFTRDTSLFVGSSIAFLLLLAFTYRSAVVFWPQVQRTGDDSAQRAWDAMLAAGLPQNAILVSNDRDEMAPLWYVQYVQGMRQDLTGLFPKLQAGPAWATAVSVTDTALATGRPVVLVKPMPGLDVRFDLEPLAGEQAGRLGPPVAVRPLPKVEPDHDLDLAYGEAVRLTGYDLTSATLMPGQSLQVVLYWEPLQSMAEDWTTFVQVLNAEGAKLGQSDHRPGGDFHPTSLWLPGERLADKHVISLPAELGPGAYRLVAGLYLYPSEPLRHLGEPQTIAEISAAR